MKLRIESQIRDSIKVKEGILRDTKVLKTIDEVAQRCVDVYASKRRSCSRGVAVVRQMHSTFRLNRCDGLLWNGVLCPRLRSTCIRRCSRLLPTSTATKISSSDRWSHLGFRVTCLSVFPHPGIPLISWRP